MDAEIPQDPMILLSFVNMKLRDRYPSLDGLCEDLNIEKDLLQEKLGAAGWLRYITPSAWGIAVFGHMCGLNGWTEHFSKDFYGYHPLIPLATLAAIALLFLFLTIARLKRTYRQKDQ